MAYPSGYATYHRSVVGKQKEKKTTLQKKNRKK